MKIAAIPCPATRNRTPAIFRPSFRRSHVRRGNLMPSGGRNRRRLYGSEIKDSRFTVPSPERPVSQRSASRFTVPAVGFSTLPVLRHEVSSAEGNFAVGSGRMRGLWLQAAAAGEYECTGSERSGYIGKYGFSDCFAVGAAERLLGIPGRSDRSERPGSLPHLGNGSCGFGQNSLVKWNRMSGNFSCASDSA